MKWGTTIIVFMLSCLVGQSQNFTPSPSATFAIKGGLIAGNLVPARGNVYRIAYQGGFATQIRLKGKNYVQMEVLYSNEGTNYLKNEIPFYNIIVPILYKRDLNNWMSIECGPQLTITVVNRLSPWAIWNRAWTNAALGLSVDVTDRNYVNFRYTRGLTPVLLEPDYFSSVFTITFINEF